MHDLLNGPKVATRRVRPPRVAFIVDDLDHCETLVEVCSLNWGGKFFLIVPHDPERGITDEWWPVLTEYDPDRVVACVELEETTHRRLQDLTRRHIPGNADRGADPMQRWEPKPDASGVHGQSIYSALAGLGAYENRRKFAPALIPDFGDRGWHPLEPYIKAHYGYLNEEHRASILRKGNLVRSIELRRLVPIQPLLFADDFDGERFVRTITRDEYDPREERRPELSLIDYTTAGLSVRIALGRRDPFLGGKLGKGDGRYILVVSADEPCVEDFCWFWCLRAQRRDPHGRLPLWLPKRSVERHKGLISNLFYRGAGGYLVSKSVAGDELTQLADGLGKGVEAATTDLHRLYYRDFIVGIEDQREVFFTDGAAHLPASQVDAVKFNGGDPWADGHQHHYLDVEMTGVELPRLNTAAWSEQRDGGVYRRDQYRVSRTGLSFYRDGLTDQREHIRINIPTEWEMLEAFADRGGYAVRLGDTGVLARSVLDLIGGMGNAWILSGSSVFNLLDELAALNQAKEMRNRLQPIYEYMRASGATGALTETDFADRVMREIASDNHDRVQQKYSRMRQTLGFDQPTTRCFVAWLLRRRLVVRGAELECSVFKTKQWQTVDALGSEMRCAGCQAVADTPLDPENTQWQYRANTLYARAHAQGVVPQLLTLSYGTTLTGREILEDGRNVFGAFTGIVLTAQQYTDVDPPEIEVDVAWIEDDALVIGECKTVARELTVGDIGAYGKAAGLLRCERVVFAALQDDFSSVLDDVREAIDRLPVQAILLGREQLLDQYLFKRSSPEEGFREHLRNFLAGGDGAGAS